MKEARSVKGVRRRTEGRREELTMSVGVSVPCQPEDAELQESTQKTLKERERGNSA